MRTWRRKFAESEAEVPIYDFNCSTCGSFEVMRPTSESSSPAICPDCGSEAKRIYSMPSFKSLSEGQKELRRIEERGSEPTVSAKPPKHDHGGGIKKGRGRPWQLGH